MVPLSASYQHNFRSDVVDPSLLTAVGSVRQSERFFQRVVVAPHVACSRTSQHEHAASKLHGNQHHQHSTPAACSGILFSLDGWIHPRRHAHVFKHCCMRVCARGLFVCPICLAPNSPHGAPSALRLCVLILNLHQKPVSLICTFQENKD